MTPDNKIKNEHLLGVSSDALSQMVSTIDEVGSAVTFLAGSSNQAIAKRAAILARKLESFAPSITLIGQVKAGKTALVNAIVGQPGLLPSDINPWTSVVTELKINQRKTDKDHKAKFTFFNRSEWDDMVSTGGRLGEMAGRAGASEDVEKIQQQVMEMRESTEARLGNSFELLLGKTHKYGYFDDELIQRYVCAGDPDEETEDPNNKQGQFSDITRSAELSLSIPQLPIALRLRDTPGVNDTFMIREQVTLKSLRGSEICLLVLSAHQALNTTDMALIRMISNFENRQVILFVNRIDELANPGKQIQEIRENLTKTLKDFSAAEDYEIIFGSAKWAEIALTGKMEEMHDDSIASLLDYAEHAEIPPEIAESDTNGLVWVLSGVPALMDAVYTRILQGSGARLIKTMSSRLTNLQSQLKAEQGEYKRTKITDNFTRLDAAETELALNKLADNCQAKLEVIIDTVRIDLHERLERAQNNFVRRATDALITHLDRFGEQDTWQYDATGLRLLFRSAYVHFSASLKKQVSSMYADTASSIEEIYFRAIGFEIDEFKIEPPVVASVPPPVVLARTIALDLNSNWWRRWWQKRKGFEAFANDYSLLIKAEVASLMNELEGDQISNLFEEIEQTMQDFILEQRSTLINISNNKGKDVLSKIPSTNDKSVKAALEKALETLNKFAA